MKKWTLMVIPEGHGATRTIRFYATYGYALVGIVVLLSFTSAFFVQRYRVANRDAEQLREENYRLESANGTAAGNSSLTTEELATLEEEIRAPYEARDAALSAALSELYDVEAQVREIHGLPPRTSSLGAEPTEGLGGGKGGPGSSGDMEVLFEGDVHALRPPHLIYGLSQPSADLMLQEIGLRTESLRQLLADLEVKQDQVARTPSIWPSLHASRRISSRYGLRRDPFTRVLSSHHGTDIVALHGSAVIATAKGVVITARYEVNLGNVVKVDHGNGLVTCYGHMQKRLVEKGDEVERGDIVGKLGNTGKRSTGPHIHYEVSLNSRRVDPEKYFRD